MPVELHTSRLRLCELQRNDSPFVLALLNSPGWLRYIGDRGVHTTEDAERYMEERIIRSYAENGFGLWKAMLHEIPVGLCGFVKRDSLPAPDLGFAFLPEYEGQGYATEAAIACMQWAHAQNRFANILGITLPANKGSIRVLEKAGLHYVEDIRIPGDEEVLQLFSLK